MQKFNRYKEIRNQKIKNLKEKYWEKFTSNEIWPVWNLKNDMKNATQ